mmetsp:Transcript_2635/g.7224  ORF Transcript_2635/g.7224 Transcript_2635/m.7224 type:complete len:284 (+) Transcript_2635:1433-2284(+)
MLLRCFDFDRRCFSSRLVSSASSSALSSLTSWLVRFWMAIFVNPQSFNFLVDSPPSCESESDDGNGPKPSTCIWILKKPNWTRRCSSRKSFFVLSTPSPESPSHQSGFLSHTSPTFRDLMTASVTFDCICSSSYFKNNDLARVGMAIWDITARQHFLSNNDATANLWNSGWLSISSLVVKESGAPVLSKISIWAADRASSFPNHCDTRGPNPPSTLYAFFGVEVTVPPHLRSFSSSMMLFLPSLTGSEAKPCADLAASSFISMSCLQRSTRRLSLSRSAVRAF